MRAQNIADAPDERGLGLVGGIFKSAGLRRYAAHGLKPTARLCFLAGEFESTA
jgi:hypothetical protein